MTARDALRLATRGGADVLGRPDVGQLKVGLCADVALYDLNTLSFAGAAVHDPVASLVLCSSPQAAYVVVQGRVIVKQGQIVTLDLPVLLEQHRSAAIQLVAA